MYFQKYVHQRCPSTNLFFKLLPGFQSGFALCSSYTSSILGHNSRPWFGLRSFLLAWHALCTLEFNTVPWPPAWTSASDPVGQCWRSILCSSDPLAERFGWDREGARHWIFKSGATHSETILLNLVTALSCRLYLDHASCMHIHDFNKKRFMPSQNNAFSLECTKSLPDGTLSQTSLGSLQRFHIHLFGWDRNLVRSGGITGATWGHGSLKRWTKLFSHSEYQSLIDNIMNGTHQKSLTW